MPAFLAVLDALRTPSSQGRGPSINHRHDIKSTTPTPIKFEEPTLTAFTTNLDVFAEAISLAETGGVQTGDLSFVAHPDDVLTLMTLKTLADSNEPLLGTDATAVTSRSVLGVPLYSSIAVEPGIAWAVPRSRVFVVIRTDPQVVSDTSAYFGSDGTAIRCILRVGFGFPHQEAIVKVVLDGGS